MSAPDPAWLVLANDVTYYSDMLRNPHLRLSEYQALVGRFESAQRALLEYEAKRTNDIEEIGR